MPALSSLKTDLDGCLAYMDDELHDTLRERLAMWEAHGLLIFSNHDLSSPHVDRTFAIPYGPNNTIKAPPADRRCLVTPPQGHAWQYRLEAYC